MSVKGRPIRHMYARNSLPDRGRQPKYYVPAEAIRRPVSLDDPEVLPLLRGARKHLGKHYLVNPPSSLCLGILDRTKLVESMWEAGVRPTPAAMWDLALSTREDLRKIIATAPTELPLALGRVDRFGPNRNILGITALGWRGYRAHYASHDEQDRPLALGMIAAETKLALGAIAAAMAPHRRFSIDALAQTPYIAVATHSGPILDRELRAVQSIFEDILPTELLLDDPVIDLSYMRGQKPELIYVRDHSAAVTDIQANHPAGKVTI